MIEVRGLPSRIKNTGMIASHTAIDCIIDTRRKITIKNLVKSAPVIIAGISVITGIECAKEIINISSEVGKLPNYANTLDIAKYKINDARHSLESKSPQTLMRVGEWSLITIPGKSPNPKEASESLKLLGGDYPDLFAEDGISLKETTESLDTMSTKKTIDDSELNQQMETIKRMEEKVDKTWQSPERKKWENLRDRMFPFQLIAVISSIGILYSSVNKVKKVVFQSKN